MTNRPRALLLLSNNRRAMENQKRLTRRAHQNSLRRRIKPSLQNR